MAHSYTTTFYTLIFFFVVSIFFIEITNGEVIANITVAADGSGNYTAIKDAILAAPTLYFIFVKKGIYREKVIVDHSKWNLTLIGEGMDSTIISSNMGCGGNMSSACTYDSATFGKNMLFLLFFLFIIFFMILILFLYFS
jgi:pectin methylesterase-like acyl-CoA thioesterase